MSPPVGASSRRAVPRRGDRLRHPRPRALPRPRPQGRPGRRPRAALRARRPRAVRSTSRRTSTASTSARRRRPYERGRAPRRRGPRRGAHVVPDQRRHAGQPRAVPRAGAARHARRRPAQLARLAGRRARALGRRAGLRRRPSTTPSWAWRTASSRPRCATRWRGAPDAAAAFIVSPTYYGMAADVAGCAEVAHAAGVPLDRRPGLGPALRLPRGAAAQRARAGRRRRAHEHAQDRRLADPERDAPRRGTATASTPRRSAARSGWCARPRPSSLLLASLDGARRQMALHGEQLLHETLAGDRGVPREARDHPRHRRSSTAASSGGPASPATTRCASCVDVRETGAHRLRGRRGAAALLRRASRARDAGDDRLPRRAGRAARRCCASPATSRRSSSASPRGLDRADRPAAGDAAQRDGGRAARRVPRRGRGGRRRRRGRPRLVRVDRRLPAGHPGAAPGRAHLGRDGRLPARARRQRARGCTAPSDPSFERVHVLVEADLLARAQHAVGHGQATAGSASAPRRRAAPRWRSRESCTSGSWWIERRGPAADTSTRGQRAALRGRDERAECALVGAARLAKATAWRVA